MLLLLLLLLLLSIQRAGISTTKLMMQYDSQVIVGSCLV
jgi:hypothetical protein